jgi:hypothetical protein
MSVTYFDLYVTDSNVASGSPGKTTLTPTLTSLKTIGASPGTDVSSHATIAEIAKGHYQIAYDAEAFGEAVGEVDCGAALSVNTDRYLPVSFARDSGRIATNLDAQVSAVAASVWGVGSRTLTGFGFSVTVGTNSDKSGYSLAIAPPTASAITTAVVAGMASSPVGSVANISPLATDGGAVSASPTPTTTTFTATGNLHAPAGGYSLAPMSIFWLTGINQGMKFAISAHAVSGGNHAFTVAAMPNAPGNGDTFAIV